MKNLQLILTLFRSSLLPIAWTCLPYLLVAGGITAGALTARKYFLKSSYVKEAMKEKPASYAECIKKAKGIEEISQCRKDIK